MTDYDPEQFPDPEEWLELDEAERISLVSAYHEQSGEALPNVRLHACAHTIVETQVAAGEEMPVRATLLRLMAEGLDRHDAVHAIGAVVMGIVFHIVKGEKREGNTTEEYYAALKELTADGWRSGKYSDPDDE